MLPDPIATLLFSPFPFRQTCLFASVCHSVHRYARDPCLPHRLKLAQARVHHLNSDELSVRRSGLDDMLLVLLNAHHEPLPFTLPAHKRSVRWQMILDTAATKQGRSRAQCCGVEPRTTSTRELVYHRHDATRDEATQDIFEYIEVFYNRRRRHSTLGYYSPADFEARTAVA